MDEIRVFGYCESCTNEVNDAGGDHYVDQDGRVYCSIECVFEKYGIVKIEV